MCFDARGVPKDDSQVNSLQSDDPVPTPSSGWKVLAVTGLGKLQIPSTRDELRTQRVAWWPRENVGEVGIVSLSWSNRSRGCSPPRVCLLGRTCFLVEPNDRKG